MDAIRVKAYQEFNEKINELFQAVNEDDLQKQLIALNQAIDSLQDAKKATAEICGGILN